MKKKQASVIPVRLQGSENALDQYRLLFFVVLTALEIFILLVGICLKWHLVAFEKAEIISHKRQSFQRVTLTSNQPLISESESRRASKA
ncbi:hypothetical protein COOONC_13500 [Cooperia oncophora]